MAESLFFNSKQRLWVGEALEIAESLAEDYFQVNLGNLGQFPYDLQTLANLQSQEKTRRALAQVCKYEWSKRTPPLKRGTKEFYRICLQDDKILDTVRTETSSLSLLKSLLLYIVTHELIHVVRFSMAPQRFFLRPEEKRAEEKDVHRMTYELLKSFADPQVGLWAERYRPWWGKCGLEAEPSVLDKFCHRA
ncbi:MAG: hypothetical protein KKH04_15230 [Proteobacteria bacterium]|nr:hypothetical protein [Pseudomonadota bacterium]